MLCLHHLCNLFVLVSFQGHHSLASLYLYNNDRFASPPPAHMGIPPIHIDPKTGEKQTAVTSACTYHKQLSTLFAVLLLCMTFTSVSFVYGPDT